MVNTQTWQDYLDPPLVQRLWRPVTQPGAMDGRMVEGLFHRYYHFLPPGPLLQQALQRQTHLPQPEPAAVPIVYAQPWVSGEESSPQTDGNSRPATGVTSDAGPSVNPTPAVSPIQSSGQSTIIQAKLDPSANPTTQSLSPPLEHHAAAPSPGANAPQSPSNPPIIQAKLDSSASTSAVSQPLPRPNSAASQDSSAPSSQPLVSLSLPVIRASEVQATGKQPVPDKPAAPPSADQQTLDNRLPRVVAAPPQRQPLPQASASSITPSSIAPPVVQPLPFSAAPPSALPKTPAFTLPLAQGTATPHTGRAEPKATGDATSPRNAPTPSGTVSPLPVVSGPPVDGRSPDSSAAPTSPAVDMAQLTDQVERRLRRKLVVERERRGWSQ